MVFVCCGESFRGPAPVTRKQKFRRCYLARSPNGPEVYRPRKLSEATRLEPCAVSAHSPFRWGSRPYSRFPLKTANTKPGRRSGCPSRRHGQNSSIQENFVFSRPEVSADHRHADLSSSMSGSAITCWYSKDYGDCSQVRLLLAPHPHALFGRRDHRADLESACRENGPIRQQGCRMRPPVGRSNPCIRP